MILNDLATADEAQALCQQESPPASLMEADSQAEFDFLTRYLEFVSPVEVLWTGLTIADATGGGRAAFRRDGTELAQSSFAGNTTGGVAPYIANEPDGSGTTCVLHVVRTGSEPVGGYRDVLCSRVRRFVCERADFDPNVPPTDSVTPVPDLTFDADGYAVDPNTGTGKFRLFDGSRLNHSAAEMACSADVAGGHLAYPVTAAERDFLQTYVNTESAAQVLWIGGVINDPASQDFTFTSGAAPGAFSYDSGTKTFKTLPSGAFESGQPDLATRACLLHVGASGGWRDIECDKLRAYICQRPE